MNAPPVTTRSGASRALDLPRLHLVHAPTPLVHAPRLGAKLGVDLWVKRDDATSGAESGNKVRKLEFLLADAIAKKADVVLTCGGIQSNHARATAITAAAEGLKSVLFLRTADPSAPLPRAGNVLLDLLVGAEIRPITAAEYAQRNAVMDSAALDLERQGRRAYVIPEGGSNGLGALGYVETMREVKLQLGLGLGGGPAPFDVVVHACGSGGTAAGLALGAAHFSVARGVRAMAVCDDAAYFERAIERIIVEARGFDPDLDAMVKVTVDDAAKGPAYGVMSAEQRRFLLEVARTSGLVLDPVYTGKAMFGLAQAIKRGDVAPGARILFVHTGGLPGLLADGAAFTEELAAPHG
jgi:D-cysteine desulfhydrase